MTVAGYVFLILGFGVLIVGEVMLLAVAYKKGAGWFLGCLFIPPLWLVFLALYFSAAVKPVAIALLGGVLLCLGASMAGVQL